jgi:aspartate/methionine/tyrosine aminotransferase
MQFADRLNNVETSAIRELFKLLGKPGIISFAGGFPDSAMFDVEGIREASARALTEEPGAALQYGATEGYNPLREQLAAFMASKGVKGLAPDGLIVTTGSQQALDLVAKTLINPNDVVLVEAPTFLATIQCFRLYGPQVIGVPIDADGVKVDQLEDMMVKHKPKLVYLIPTFGNPSGAMMSLERRLKVLELAVKYQTVVVEDDPYGDLYFAEPPPPSLLALTEQVPGSRDWLVHCGSLSKVLSPGLRLGWMIAPSELLAKATMCKQFSDAHTSTFAQATAAQYLKAGRMPATLEKVRRVYAERAKSGHAIDIRERVEKYKGYIKLVKEYLAGLEAAKKDPSAPFSTCEVIKDEKGRNALKEIEFTGPSSERRRAIGDSQVRAENLLRDLEVDPHVTRPVAVELRPVALNLAELRACRQVLDAVEILRLDLEFIEHLELLQRGELRDLGGADFVEDDLEHAWSLSYPGRVDMRRSQTEIARH